MTFAIKNIYTAGSIPTAVSTLPNNGQRRLLYLEMQEVAIRALCKFQIGVVVGSLHAGVYVLWKLTKVPENGWFGLSWLRWVGWSRDINFLNIILLPVCKSLWLHCESLSVVTVRRSSRWTWSAQMLLSVTVTSLVSSVWRVGSASSAYSYSSEKNKEYRAHSAISGILRKKKHWWSMEDITTWYQLWASNLGMYKLIQNCNVRYDLLYCYFY